MLNSREVCDLLKIHKQTLWNWRKEGLVHFVKTPSGRYLYDENEINRILHKSKETKLNTKIVLYSRVSTTIQKGNLERQRERLKLYASAKGYIVDEDLSDIGSGLNENRKNFQKLLKMVSTRQVKKVIVEYQDRLIRIGFNIIEEIFNGLGTEIIVLDHSEEKSYRQEIIDDMIAIIHHYSMKLYSSRKRKEIKKLLNEISKNNNTQEQ